MYLLHTAASSRLLTRYEYGSSGSAASGPHPTKVTAGGAAFALTHDRAGGLAEASTPSGHRHRFRRTTMIGRAVLTHRAPWAERPTMYVYGGRRRLRGVVRTDGTTLRTGEEDQEAVEVRRSDTEEVRTVEVAATGDGGRRRLFRAATRWTCLDSARCLDYAVNCTVEEAAVAADTSRDLVVASDVVTRQEF